MKKLAGLVALVAALALPGSAFAWDEGGEHHEHHPECQVVVQTEHITVLRCDGRIVVDFDQDFDEE